MWKKTHLDTLTHSPQTFFFGPRRGLSDSIGTFFRTKQRANRMNNLVDYSSDSDSDNEAPVKPGNRVAMHSLAISGTSRRTPYRCDATASLVLKRDLVCSKLVRACCN